MGRSIAGIVVVCSEAKREDWDVRGYRSWTDKVDWFARTKQKDTSIAGRKTKVSELTIGLVSVQMIGMDSRRPAHAKRKKMHPVARAAQL
eukprot:6214371-Pleurochrysis_carterae.AAC.3